MMASVKLAKDSKDVNSVMSLKCRPVSFTAEDKTDLQSRISNLHKIVINLMKIKVQVGRKKRQSEINHCF